MAFICDRREVKYVFLSFKIENFKNKFWISNRCKSRIISLLHATYTQHATGLTNYKQKQKQKKSKNNDSNLQSWSNCETILHNSFLPLRKISLFHLISWCGNFVERDSFCINSGDSQCFSECSVLIVDKEKTFWRWIQIDSFYTLTQYQNYFFVIGYWKQEVKVKEVKVNPTKQ